MGLPAMSPACNVPFPQCPLHIPAGTPCPSPRTMPTDAAACKIRGAPQPQGVPRRGSPAPRHTVGAVWVPAPSWGHREQESRKANWSSRLRISGFWFPFLLPAVSMETGVGPRKIRLGFAAEAHCQPACLCAPPALPPHRGHTSGYPPCLHHGMLRFGG